jgi:transcriptional regulator with XRE-family HTH domain
MEKSIFTPEQKVFEQLLREYRTEAGLTQGQLAERLATLQTIVSNIEIGERRLDILELRQVCKALGVTLRDFVDKLEDRLDSL